MIIFPINIHINQVPLSKIILEITIQLTTYTTYLHKLLIIKNFERCWVGKECQREGKSGRHC